MNREVDAAIELLKGALRREAEGYPLIMRFLGLEPHQILALKRYWEEQHPGQQAEDIQ